MRDLETAADAALAAVLHSCLYDRHPVTLVMAPPGAGKTWLLEAVVSMAVLELGERVAVATQTNAQSLDLLHRLVTAFPTLPVVLHARADLPLPAHLAARTQHIARARDLPKGPCVVLANSAKWRYADPLSAGQPFDMLVVDEAFQMPDAVYAQIGALAVRHLLVGDPGQIAPVVSIDTRAWRSRADGPHQPAPRALLARRPHDVRTVQLPATRRLGPDTAAIVQPAFYPLLPFGSLRPPRSVHIEREAGPYGPLLSRLAHEEIVMAELPPAFTGQYDPAVAGSLAAIAADAASGGWLVGGGEPQRLSPDRIAVACAHVSQVGQVQAELRRSSIDLTAVTVDTSERLQGREADLVLVWHPASGQAEVSDFAKDGGRLCVMLSRHRAACVVVARAGIASALERAGAGAERVLGVEEDSGLRGWAAHRDLLRLLDTRGRIQPM